MCQQRAKHQEKDVPGRVKATQRNGRGIAARREEKRESHIWDVEQLSRVTVFCMKIYRKSLVGWEGHVTVNSVPFLRSTIVTISLMVIGASFSKNFGMIRIGMKGMFMSMPC